MLRIFLIIMMTFGLTACMTDESSDAKQRVAQEALASQGNAVAGMPAIVNFQEKRILKDIIEMRDKAITTVTYTQDMNGRLIKLCDSIGFGISSATQYTNPSRVWILSGHTQVLPQADPNGLFSPSSAEGTWVMCKDPKSGKVAPVYAEPRIIVSTFPLN
jgi:hypothetical protein